MRTIARVAVTIDPNGQQDIETENVFAGLFMVILIGIVVENVIFRNIELRTVNRWGMQR